MYYQRLSDEEILSGFREGDADIIREYFYGYCQVGYNIFDQRYQLREKENLDFMSLAHQYALYLMEHDWKPLEDHSPNVSLKTWLINGFRYVVLEDVIAHLTVPVEILTDNVGIALAETAQNLFV